MDLDARYKKWEQFASGIDGDGEPAKLSKEDLRDVKFSLGKPLTEEEFKRYRRTNQASVVGSVSR